MDAASALSRGALDKLFPVPVLQCLQVKQMAPSAQGGDRFRLVMSDGQHYVQTMLATQANHVVHDNKLVRGCIARIKQYTPNNLKGKNILVILDIEVIESLGVQEKIGEPFAVDSKPAAQEGAIAGGDFYGVKKEESKTQPQQFQQQQQQSMPSRPANHAGSNIYPIEDIKTWHKATGEGKLFSVNLLDESGEIKATGFNDQCDAFYDRLQEGSVYYISTPCRVALAKKQFSNLTNDYELTFERDTELQSVEKDNTVDVIGVLKEVGEVGDITSKKDGRPFQKRELTLVDDTGFSVRVTIWGKSANSFDAPPESVVAFKGTKVKDENLGMDDQAYYTIKATIVFVKQENFCYPACLSQGCNKKVTQMPDGTWHCEKCAISHEKPEYRHQWLSCFDDSGRQIVGRTADEMMELKENDDNKFMAAFEEANCKKFTFRCRAKMDNFGEAQRIRYQVMTVTPLDFKSEGTKLDELIKQYESSSL
ncbi:hypothetical protein LB503_001771 [Fusarium chuoi]|nr:hypothetical protein LB503_001771 [Fusarium chuoi]